MAGDDDDATAPASADAGGMTGVTSDGAGYSTEGTASDGPVQTDQPPPSEHDDWVAKAFGQHPDDSVTKDNPAPAQASGAGGSAGNADPASGGAGTGGASGGADQGIGGAPSPGSTNPNGGGPSAGQPVSAQPVEDDSTPVVTPGQSEFGYYFSNCMGKLGLPAPTSFFTTATAATAAVAAIEKAVTTFGTEVTIGELIGAGVLSEALMFAGACTATAYAGACVSCAAGAGIRTVLDI